MKMKKLISIFLSAAVFACVFSGCSETGGKLKVVCTLFPQYDFVREIAGDKVDLTLLLAPGDKSHGSKPNRKGMTAIVNCGLFIYTGDYMEPWVADKMKTIQKKDAAMLDASEGIALDIDMANEELAEQEGNEDHVQLLEPHFWLLPLNAAITVEKITAELCKLDPANAEFYQTNASAYKLKLEELDAGFRTAVGEGKRKTIIIADRFAFYYFVKEYKIGYLAAYPSCTAKTEPDAAVITKLENAVTKQQIPAVFYRELSDKKIAEQISAATGAKMLLFHACENLSAEETEAGATYLSLMGQNLENLKVALG